MDQELTPETATGPQRRQRPRFTTADVLRMPPVMSLVDAARAWDIGRSQAYELARQGALPFRAVRLKPAPGGGSRGDYKVRLVDLLDSLGIDQSLIAAQHRMDVEE